MVSEHTIGKKIWHFCNTLRDDGINYSDYVEQITYILFLKIANEKGIQMPNIEEEVKVKHVGMDTDKIEKKIIGIADWKYLIKFSGEELIQEYERVLKVLSNQEGILGDIFGDSKNWFRKPVHLKKFINMINEINFTEDIDYDLKGKIYEDLLERNATETKGGAGQYFTPRQLIKAICKVMKPKVGNKISDPASGTGGFLIQAYEQILEDNNYNLDPDQENKLKNEMFFGNDIEIKTKRLCVMNMFLHGINAHIKLGDSLVEQEEGVYDMILTNPPFGTKSGGENPNRSDFNVETSNKQLNFMQHILSALKDSGKAAVVLPDNVLFEDNAGKQIRKELLKKANLHTILRLPVGIFYAQGVKANVLFFHKGNPTKDIKYFDMRTNYRKINKTNPLLDKDFDDFLDFYENNIKSERGKSYSIKEIKNERDYNLDIFWIKDESLDSGVYEEPEVILQNIKKSEEKILSHIDDILRVIN